MGTNEQRKRKVEGAIFKLTSPSTLSLTLILIALFHPTFSSLAPTEQSKSSGEFTAVRNGNFIKNGEIKRYGGTNNYYLMYSNQYIVSNVLATAHSHYFNLIRTWAFIDIGFENNNSISISGKAGDGVYFQFLNSTTMTPQVNEGSDGLEYLDYLLFRAAQFNVQLIFTLTNNWQDFGGVDQYVEWRAAGDDSFRKYHDSFYSDPIIQQWYKQYVNKIINRVNTITGIKYKDDPTIFGWELINEPRCSGSNIITFPSSPSCNQSLITQWVSMMSEYIQSIDDNHLVAVGDEGWYCWEGSNDWTSDCSQGVDTLSFAALSTIDFMTFHLYPDSWRKSLDWTYQWILSHLHFSKEYNKPIIMEEFGYQIPTNDNDPTRFEVYSNWTSLVNKYGGNGDLFWMLNGRQLNGSFIPDYDGFAIDCPSVICAELSYQSKLITANITSV